jgi:Fic family protein
MYLWQRAEWPKLSWDARSVSPLIARVSREPGRLLGRMEGIGFDLRGEAHLRTLTEDVIKSSEIEGEKLERDQGRSPIARRLGLHDAGVDAERPASGNALLRSR